MASGADVAVPRPACGDRRCLFDRCSAASGRRKCLSHVPRSPYGDLRKKKRASGKPARSPQAPLPPSDMGPWSPRGCLRPLGEAHAATARVSRSFETKKAGTSGPAPWACPLSCSVRVAQKPDLPPCAIGLLRPTARRSPLRLAFQGRRRRSATPVAPEIGQPVAGRASPTTGAWCRTSAVRLFS